MDIIAGIGAATEGLKLLNELGKIDKEVDKSELKLRLVDITDKLLDSKQALQDAQEREAILKGEIESLEKRLEDRGKFSDQDGSCLKLIRMENSSENPIAIIAMSRKRSSFD